MWPMIRRIIARTDVTTDMGTGHLMRCRSLAQRLKDFGVSAEFLMAQCPEELGRALTDEGFDFVRVNCAPGSIKDANFTAKAAASAACLSSVGAMRRIGNTSDWLPRLVYRYGFVSEASTTGIGGMALRR